MVSPCTSVQGERAGAGGKKQPEAKNFGRRVCRLEEKSPASLLHIVHVIATVDPDSGGPMSVVTRLAAAQAAEGHAVRIVSALEPGRRAAFEGACGMIPGLDRVTFELA